MPYAARILFALALTSLPAVAQIASIQIGATPSDGIQFIVDGQAFYGSQTFLWPQGSKHNVSVSMVEYGNTPKAQYVFTGWTINGPVPQTYAPLSLVVTADPSIQSVIAGFNTNYEFDLIYFTCPTDGSPCLSPGSVLVNNTAYVQTTSMYLGAGSTITVLAQPNPGYIFTGWINSPGSGNTGEAFTNTYTLNGPLSIYPQFSLSRPISVGITTAPAGLQVMADHTSISSPASLEWGTGTVHSLSVASPQTDLTGGTWVFSSWSDNGAQTHNYTVPDGYSTLSLSATFVQAYHLSLATSPTGLSVNVNGKPTGSTLTFTGASGTQYQLSAPATQTDSQGRINQFVSWSNGGAETQTLTQPPNDLRLTANYLTLGHLSLISSPPGLSFLVNGKACVSPCSFDEAPGTQMSISVPSSIPLSAASRLDFQGWQDGNGASRIYTMTASVQTLSALYQTMYMVAAASVPPVAGAVILQPSSPDGFYPANTQLQASVSQNPGFQFRSWQGDLAGSQAYASLNVSSPKTIGATFTSVPYLPPAAVQNAAGVTQVSGVAPGSIVSIYGVNLANATLSGPASPLAQTILNVTATLGQQILPIYFVSPQQINVQLPYETSLGSQLLLLHQTGQPDVNAVFSVVRNAPGLFAIYHADGTLVNASSAAAVGETLTVTGTGFGPYDQNPQDGIAVPSSASYNLLDSVTINAGSAIPALSAGPASNAVGLNFATFQVPSSLPSGTSIPLSVTINGATSNQLSLFLQ